MMLGMACRRGLGKYRPPHYLNFIKPSSLHKQYFHASRALLYNKDNMQQQLSELQDLKEKNKKMAELLKRMSGSFPAIFSKALKGLEGGTPRPDSIYQKMLQIYLLAIEGDGRTVVSKEVKENLQEAMDELLKYHKEIHEKDMLGVVDMVFDHVTVQLNKETLSQIEDKQKQREDNEKRIQEEHQAREQKKILAELADQANKSSAESSSTSTHTSTSTSSSSDTASSTSSTESPKASSSSSTGIPKIPWIADVNVDDLGSPSFFGYSKLMWYRLTIMLTRGGFSLDELRQLTPSRLAKNAGAAIASFANALNEGDMPLLRRMVVPKLYEHIENTLNTYKEKKIKFNLQIKSVDEGFFTEINTYPFINTQEAEKVVGLIPGMGASMAESNGVIIRKKTTDGFIFVQEEEKGQTNEINRESLVAAMSGENTNYYIYAQFSFYTNCNEIYYIEDEAGQLMAGSKSQVENGHIFTFWASFAEMEWRILDLNGFNLKVAEEVPLTLISPDEIDIVLRDYKKK